MKKAAESLKPLLSSRVPVSGPPVTVQTARSGDPVLESGGVLLESRYDPVREARKRKDRLAEALVGKDAVVLLGDGACYLAEILALEGVEVVVVEAAPSIPLAACRVRGAEAFSRFSLLFTADLSTVDDVIRFLPPPERTLFVDHAPSGRLFPEEYARVGELIRTSLQREVAGLGTITWFGRRWLGNIIANLGHTGYRSLQPLSSGDVVIAVPGPSLPRTLSLLRERDRFLLLALAPTLPWLMKEGITPDLVVTSDGGYANLLHFCGVGQGGIPLVFPLMAYSGIPHLWPGPLVPVSMGMGPEPQLLLPGALPLFPECPTVAVFALHLAVFLGAARVFLAGQDLGQSGWRGHVPGYRFEEEALILSTRTVPAAARLARPFREQWEEEGGFRSSPAFRLYRDGLLEVCRRLPVPVHGLSESPLLRDLYNPDALPETAAQVELVTPPAGAVDRGGVSRLLAALKRASAVGGGGAPERLLADPDLSGILSLLRPGALHQYRERGAVPDSASFFEGLAPLLQQTEGRLTPLL